MRTKALGSVILTALLLLATSSVYADSRIETLAPGDSFTVRAASGFSLGGDDANAATLFYIISDHTPGVSLEYQVFNSADTLLFTYNSFGLNSGAEYWARSDFNNQAGWDGYLGDDFRASDIDHITFANKSPGDSGKTISLAVPSIYFGTYSASGQDWTPINYLPSDASQSARVTPLSPADPMIISLTPDKILSAVNDSPAPSTFDKMTLFYNFNDLSASEKLTYDVYKEDNTLYYSYGPFAIDHLDETTVRSDFISGWMGMGSLSDFYGSYGTFEFNNENGAVNFAVPSFFYGFYNGYDTNGNRIAVDYIPANVKVTPEPVSSLLFGLGALTLAAAKRRKK